MEKPGNGSNGRYHCTIPDLAYWRQQIKCQWACPVHTDARGYIRAIAEGDFQRAYLIARGPNPFASICGRICGAPCEDDCRRGDIDEAVSIRALKRTATERYGPESEAAAPLDLEGYLSSQPLRDCEDLEELRPLLAAVGADASRLPQNHPAPTESSPPVAIVGSGPAGLACAQDLALLGFRPIVYEREPVPAGMLYLGVPEYRLPREVIRAEVEVIQNLGVDIRCGVEVGRDVSLAQLRQEHAAVVIGVGLRKSRGLPIPGADAPGVVGGVEFLRQVNLGRPVDLGERVVVIGGGNVAYDVARTVLRQEQYDVSRTVVRQPGVREVHLCCLESLEEMPADIIEIEEGEEEGVQRHNSLGPVAILTDEEGHVSGVQFQRCLRVYDETGAFRPVFDENERTEIACDTVLLSVGQAPDLSLLEGEPDLRLTERGLIDVDPDTLQTSAPDVFVAGDLAHGPKLMIHAIASGKQAARSVYRYLTGRELQPAWSQVHFPIAPYGREVGYERTPRLPVPVRPPEERVREAKALVDLGYDREQAVCEASRCLDCGVNTIFDGQKCILCGGCVDVCPLLCLKLVPLSWLAPEGDLDALIAGGGYDPQTDSAIIKDEDRCIRCGLCAERCPTQAITMERFQFAACYEVRDS